MVSRLSAWLCGPSYTAQFQQVERDTQTLLARTPTRDAMSLMRTAQQLNPALKTETLERVAPCLVGRAEGFYEPRPNRLLLSQRAMPHVALHEIIHSFQHKASSWWNRFCYKMMNPLPRVINRFLFPNIHRSEALYRFASENLIARHPEFDIIPPAALRDFMAETPEQRRSPDSIFNAERPEFVAPLSEFAQRVRSSPSKTLRLFKKICLDEIQAYTLNNQTASQFGLNADQQDFHEHQIRVYQGLITMVRTEERRRRQR